MSGEQGQEHLDFADLVRAGIQGGLTSAEAKPSLESPPPRIITVVYIEPYYVINFGDGATRLTTKKEALILIERLARALQE